MNLSELIQIAIEALDEDAQQELSFIAYPRHETRYDELKQSAAALRAIAPALVLAAREAASRSITCGNGLFHGGVPCWSCRVMDAMREAGVSCD